MSKYRLIKSEFRNPDSLIKALNDLGIAFDRSVNLRTNDVVLKTSFGEGIMLQLYHGENHDVAIAIQRDNLAKAAGLKRVVDGMGFSWNGSGYDLIQDHYNEMNRGVTDLTNKLKQRYSFHETMRLARANGYLVKSSTSENGKIRVVIQKVG